MREFSAEMLGTFILMAFGLGVNAQVTLGKSTAMVAGAGHESAQVALTQYAHGDYLSINLGWGVAVLLGVYVAETQSSAAKRCKLPRKVLVSCQQAFSQIS